MESNRFNLRTKATLPENESARIVYSPGLLPCILKSLAARIQLFTISCYQKRYQFFRLQIEFPSTPDRGDLLFPNVKMFRWIKRWFRSPKPRIAILYTRQGCHLCELAAQTLQQADYHVQYLDIDENPELRQKFDHQIPVVEIDGRIRFRGRIDPLLLKRLG
jgi:glutaredoxin